MEQTLLKVTEQMQTLAQSIGQLKAPQAPQEGSSGALKGINGQPLEVDENQPEFNAAELKKEMEAQAKEMERKLLEKMKAFDGFDQSAILNLPQFEEGAFPEKFKAPEFEKYNGTGCPNMHTRLYVRRMGQYAKFDKLMVQTFQDSLTGPALNWYAQLDPYETDTWDKLARAFFNQYRFNIEMAPSVWDLSNMKRKKDELFKEYAQRWRALAARIATPLPEKDLTFTFINTLDEPFFSHLVGHASANFSEVVVAGCRIENAVSAGKLQAEKKFAPPKVTQYKGKEATVSVVNTSNFAKPPQQFALTTNPNPSMQVMQPPQNSQPSFKRRFTRIPVPLSQVLAKLRADNLINFEVPREDYRPKNYNPELKCEYHLGQTGHSTDNCWRLRNKIQDLIDAKLVHFDFVETSTPNVSTNPLPSHGPVINMIVNEDPQPEVDLDELPITLEQIAWNLRQMGHLTYLNLRDRTKTKPAIYQLLKEGVIKKEDILQMLVPKPRKQSTQKELWERYQAGDPTVDTLGEAGKYQYLVDYWVEPRVYISAPATGWGSEFEEENQVEKKEEEFVGMIGGGPKSIKIEYIKGDGKETPLPGPKSYTFHVPIPTVNYKAAPFNYQEVNSTSIKIVGGLTRSGRIYDPKEKDMTIESSHQSKADEKEGERLTRLMKASEYKIAEQLARTPAQISLMSLLISSEAHREALFKVLKEVRVPQGVAETTLEHIVSSIFAMDQITFSSDEMEEGGEQHTKALFIVVKCNSKIVSRVLIDNGSSLNVCPLATLNLLEIEPSNIKPNSTIVRAFDGSKREIVGEIDLEVTIGPQVFSIPFQVLDIPRSFNLLLGRPWIHAARAIPSSLHQKVKFMANGQVITVMGEQDYAIYKETAIPYIGKDEEVGLGLQMFEEACVIESLQSTQIGTFGLGYAPTQDEVVEMKGKMRKKKIDKVYDPVIEIPSIRDSFPAPSHIQQSAPGEDDSSSTKKKELTLNNWFSFPYVCTPE